MCGSQLQHQFPVPVEKHCAHSRTRTRLSRLIQNTNGRRQICETVRKSIIVAIPEVRKETRQFSLVPHRRVFSRPSLCTPRIVDSLVHQAVNSRVDMVYIPHWNHADPRELSVHHILQYPTPPSLCISHQPSSPPALALSWPPRPWIPDRDTPMAC
jgi:hypothetical protein